MIPVALTLLVAWISLKALAMPDHEQLQASLLPFAEEPANPGVEPASGSLDA